MPEFNYTTTPGQTVARELLLAFLNTGTADAPVWSVLGKRVEDSSISFDWSTETKTDILGDTYTTGKKATRTQTFEPGELDAADAAQERIWELGVRENNVNALLNQDVLLVHLYKQDGQGGAFAERYESSSILPTGLGGAGGGSLGMPIDVTFGGRRTCGTYKVVDGAGVFTAEVAV